MPLNDAGRNGLCAGLTALAGFASLHSGDPSTTGANELTGGSPAYARKAVTWAAAASGQQLSSNAQVFDVPAGATVLHAGLWSAVSGGTFYGYTPVGNFNPFAATLLASTDVFTSYAHGMSNGFEVQIADIQAAGLPVAFTEGTRYYVVSATADTFQLSATPGGAAVNAATDAEVIIQRALPEAFAGQGTYTLPIGALAVDARFF